MKKSAKTETVDSVTKLFNQIDFPEYQREPNVWDRRAKQRLVDSIMREFDVSSIYFYVDEDGIDCIDGRQRLNALMSFIGENREDSDNNFPFARLNEIFEDDEMPFRELEGLTFKEIDAAKTPIAKKFVKQFKDYKITIVELSGSRRPEEFNLQFARLNVGVDINSGEKLHAMVGDIRDACFAKNGLASHPFFASARLPTRRYGKEQVVAQILCQVFSLEGSEHREFARTRHFDLQKFFKDHSQLTPTQKGWVKKVRELLDLLARAFGQGVVLRSRAITVSVFLLAWRKNIASLQAAKELAAFLENFLRRLRWQVRKGLDVDKDYRYLIDFQRHLTQASVEKPAVKQRAHVLEEEYARWLSSGKIRGDTEFQKRTKLDPVAESGGKNASP